MHTSNSYVTLTYEDRYLPDDYSIDVRHHQLFMKRVRKRYGPVRFFLCGEYGDINRRPHYHALLFGMEFNDLIPWSRNASGDDVFISPSLTDTWGLGHCTVGDVTFQSAAYVARYVMKKRSGEDAEAHYTTVHPLTGEVVVQRPEYVAMSRGGRTGQGGIGAAWLEKFRTDVYPSDFIVINGRRVRPPRWYDAVLERDDPKLFREMKRRRKVRAIAQKADNTSRRLRVKEMVLDAKVNRLNRSL